MDNDPSEKPSILTQPVFLVALGLILFNILLFLWSMNRDTRAAEKAAGQAEQVDQLP
jgi:hypothetical protein